jgi:1-acyl-sn-glycerol-3-phosphate acyltransferase
VSFPFWEDVDQLRRGWRWEGPRPRTWAPQAPGIPDRPSNIGWARAEPVRSARWLIQHGLSMPLARVLADPHVEGREWVQGLDRPVILASNHTSHADTPLLLYALPDRVREQTVVAAAEDYWYRRPWLGRAVALWLNTFPFSRTGGAQAVLHNSSMLLKSGWNLLMYPEGTRSQEGGLLEFLPGVGFLAIETHTPVVPMHVRGSHRIMPKGRGYPLPAPVRVRIGRPLTADRGEGSRAFTKRIESAVRALAEGREPEAVGSWIDRWRATAPPALQRDAGRLSR